MIRVELRWGLALAVALLLVPGGSAPGQGQPAGKIDVKVVKYAELAKLVADHKGKVVLVDCWHLRCVPCRQAFPHTVQLHEKLASKGLVVITASFDPADKKDAVLKFLQGEKATCINVLLDEPIEVYGEKLHMASFPTVFIFNREGKYRQLNNDSPFPANQATIDRLVDEFLKVP